MITKDLGAVTAYAYAVEGGYTGTEEEFTQLMADLGITVDEFEHFSVSVSTLPAGSSATASYSNGVLSLGIPKGDKGDTGNTGATGATPQLSIGTVETTAQPSVTITGTAENPVLNFGLVKGDKGDTGEVSEAELTQAFEDFSANGTVANAEQLTTDIRANDQTPYLFRTSGGSVDIGDREYIKGIVGGTVAWNQLARGDFGSDYATYWDVYSGTGSVSNGELTITGAVGRNGAKLRTPYILNLTQGHKYLAMHEYKSDVVLNQYMIAGLTLPVANSWTQYANIVGYDGTYNYQTMDTFPSVYGVEGTFSMRNLMVVDLTQMFGSTIADYIYSLEQANAGAGVAFFKTLFPKPYYAYNAGELMSVKGLVSHDMVGFNAWDEEWEVGSINPSTGEPSASATQIRSKNFIPVISGATYYGYCESLEGTTTGNLVCNYYDANKNFVSYGGGLNGTTNAIPNDVHYIKIWTGSAYGTTYKNDICINLSWDGSRNGEYEPYQKWSYPLDSDLELRGVPKIDNGNLYYDGDVYEADGTVTRKYGIVDLGTLNWNKTTQSDVVVFYCTLDNGIQNEAQSVCSKYPTVTQQSDFLSSDKVGRHYGSSEYSFSRFAIHDSTYDNADATAFKSAMSGVYLLYELQTPTTETADPYTSPQIVSDFGTEEYVIDDDVFAIPVGHNTDYPINLKAQVEMMPHSPDGNGDYIVRQTNGVNEYVALANNATIQNIISRLEALEG